MTDLELIDEEIRPEYRVRQQGIPEEYTLHDYVPPTGFREFFRQNENKDKHTQEYITLRSIALIYLVVFIFAELNIAYVNPNTGILLHAITLVSLCFLKPHSRTYKYRLLLTLLLPPLARIFSLSIPLSLFPRELWYLIISVPIFIATFIALRLLRQQRRMSTSAPPSPRGIYFASDWALFLHLAGQVAVVSSGPLIGWVLYMVLQPSVLSGNADWLTVLLPAVIFLVATGLLEELIFRRLLLDSVAAIFGAQIAGVYVSLLFTAMYVGHHSMLMVPLVFVVSLYYSWVVSSTGRIWGVTLSHGLANVCLFLVFPLVSQFL